MFMAVCEGAAMNSGLVSTETKAVEWARGILTQAQHHKVTKVFILSLEATAERSAPPIVVIPHSPGNEAEAPPVPKPNY